MSVCALVRVWAWLRCSSESGRRKLIILVISKRYHTGRCLSAKEFEPRRHILPPRTSNEQPEGPEVSQLAVSGSSALSFTSALVATSLSRARRYIQYNTFAKAGTELLAIVGDAGYGTPKELRGLLDQS